MPNFYNSNLIHLQIMMKPIGRYSLCLIFFLSIVTVALAQEDPVITDKPTSYTAHNKGKFYVYWGWNRGYYSHSDIHFKGSDYNFTIYDAKAYDKQSKFSYRDYFRPDRVTIPQTNVRIGYFISDHYNISIGVDHMKYVMYNDQMAIVDGYIDIAESNEYNGVYNRERTHITDDFLHFEHTDGLNYINVQVERYDDLGKLLGGTWDMDVFQINLYEGLGAGVLVPKTNATILNRERYDQFHLSGFGISAHQGINLTFFKHYFVQVELKEGYINMPDIRITHSPTDSASQHFFFLEPTLMFGGVFKIS